LFEVPFEAGVLSVDGIGRGQVLHDELVTSEELAELKCTCVLKSENESEIGIYELQAYDRNGVFCPLANDEVEVTVENGYISGICVSFFTYPLISFTERMIFTAG